MYSISYISYKIFGINSLGMGDIKLTSISTIWIGIESSFLSLCISFLLSAIYSLHGRITKKFMPFQASSRLVSMTIVEGETYKINEFPFFNEELFW